MKVNLQVATLFEATPLIRLLQLERKRLPGLSHYYENASSGISLWISGIGLPALAGTLPKTVHHLRTETCLPEHWINLGIAGCGNPRVAIGTLFQVTKVNRGAEEIQKTEHSIDLPGSDAKKTLISEINALPPAQVITFDEPALVGASRQLNPAEPEGITDEIPYLFDMEAYHWAKMLTHDYQIAAARLTCFKFVSDHATEEKLNFRELAPLYDASAEHLLKQLSFL